ncbi:UNVERIFIED_CONTAM: Carboxyl-terminal-processing peptidase 2, chloroplastic [Sesamum calycinum]|uniref:C-terminal processing peptidase n=1 Tax=Sesamum calycinum TaxID=2727403 RepID=A0AAW2RB53_9LAMI
MEVLRTSAAFAVSNSSRNPTVFVPEVLLCNHLTPRKSGCRASCSFSSNEKNTASCFSAQFLNRTNRYRKFLRSLWRLDKSFVLHRGFFVLKIEFVPGLRKFTILLQKALQCAEKFNNPVPLFSLRLIVGVMLFMTFGAAVTKVPSWALSEENLLFLEAWRTLDRAYIDKTFNGQSWFKYRENALRNEPMNTREETYAAIRKMVATLDDPFTRFLEPQKFKSLRSGTRNTLTGVGLSIGYPTGKDKSTSGLVVVSAAPGGPANRAGVLSGDVILAIDETSTESMGIYDAAERLQGPEGSTVELVVRHGSETRHLSLIRAKVSLNPVKSRICRTPGLGVDGPLIGYIKLTSFNQNASGAVREAVRGNNVNAFILDLRDNSGGLFPEGVEIAKIWLDKGVIVYICDSRGVRDIYDTDGSNAVAASEPLVVLTWVPVKLRELILYVLSSPCRQGPHGTASASEILAGALKDNKRAVLVGEPTYGKGKIQSVFELSDGSGLAVTVARYETPAHTDIDKTVPCRFHFLKMTRVSAAAFKIPPLLAISTELSYSPDESCSLTFPVDSLFFVHPLGQAGRRNVYPTRRQNKEKDLSHH